MRTFLGIALSVLTAYSAVAQYFGDKPTITSMEETNYFLVTMGDSAAAAVRKVSPSNAVEILKSRGNFPNGSGSENLFTGTGSPEGVLAARLGSFYRCTNLCAGSALYVKTNGTGTTGWWLIQGGSAGTGDVTTSQLNTASNAVVALGSSGTLSASNSLRATLLTADITTSNGVLSAMTSILNVSSNDIMAAMVASDNSDRAAAVNGDNAVSNVLWSWSTAISNLVQTKQAGALGITNLATLHITGTGSPEGAVSARVGAIYACTNSCTGAGLYVKTNGTGTTGWWLIQAGAGGGGGGAPSLSYATIPPSGIVGGTQQGWVTNLSADVTLIPSNLVTDLHYYIDVHSAGKVAAISNYQAIFYRGLGQGGASSFGTNGSSTLELWVDGITGRTNGILSGPQFTIVPDGVCLFFTTNTLTRVITFTNICTGSSGTLTNAGTTNAVNTGILAAGGAAVKTFIAGANVTFGVSATSVTVNASSSTLSGALDTVTITNRARQLTQEITPGSDTNAIIDLARSGNVLLVLTTNAHLVFSNVVDGIAGRLLIKQDTNGARAILSARVVGGLLITNGPPFAYVSTNANAMDQWEYSAHYGTNVILYQRATYSDLITTSNGLYSASGGSPGTFQNVTVTNALTELEYYPPQAGTNVTIDLSKGRNVVLTLTNHAHIAFSNVVNGIKAGRLRIVQGNGGPFAVLSARVVGGNVLTPNVSSLWSYMSTNSGAEDQWWFGSSGSTNIWIYQEAPYNPPNTGVRLQYHEYFEDFLGAQLPTGVPGFGELGIYRDVAGAGTGGGGVVPFDSNSPGVQYIQLGTQISGQARIFNGHAAGNGTVYYLGGSWTNSFRFQFATAGSTNNPSGTNNFHFHSGFTDTSFGVPTNGAVLYYSSNSPFFGLICGSTGLSTTNYTTIVPTNGVWYSGDVIVLASGPLPTAIMILRGPTATNVVTITNNVPSGKTVWLSLGGKKMDGTDNRLFYIDYEYLGFALPTSR